MSEKINNAFPINVLPNEVRMYFENLEEYNRFSIDYLAGAFISMCSIYIGNKYKAKYSEGYSTNMSLWMSLVGSSSTMKTPALNKVFEPLSKLERKNHLMYKELLNNYKEDDQGNKPIEKQLIIDDYSIEALTKILYFNPHGLIIKRDELDSLLKDSGRYNSGGDEQKLLSLYSGVSTRVNRRKDDESYLTEGALLSMIGGVQTEILPKILTEERMNNGFVGRMLFVVNQKEKLLPPKRGGDESLRYNYIKFCERFEEIPTPDYPNIPCIDLNWEAYSYLENWFSETLYGEYLQGDYDNVAKSFFKKMDSNTLKFALIIQVIDSKEPHVLLNEINLSSVKKAISLSEYFIKNFIYVLVYVKESKNELNEYKLLTKYFKTVKDKKNLLLPAAHYLKSNNLSMDKISKILGVSKSTVHSYLV